MKWFEIKSPLKVKSEITVSKDGTVTATASAVKIHDPLGILPKDINEHVNVASAKCHPDDEYNRDYGVRLASNRARTRLYNYVATCINKKLDELDAYLLIIHNKIKKLEKEHDALLIEQMDIKEVPSEKKED